MTHEDRDLDLRLRTLLRDERLCLTPAADATRTVLGGVRRARRRRAAVAGGAVGLLGAAVVMLAVTGVPRLLADPAPQPPATSGPAPTTGAAPGPTRTPSPAVHRLQLGSPATNPPAPWRLAFRVGYGDRPSQLSTDTGGDDGGVMVWTPRTGVQVADGTWWFLDRVKDRLAHFDGNGRYLGQVSIAEQVKSPGCLMEWPVALADGSLVMTCEGDLVALDTRTQTLRTLRVELASEAITELVPRAADATHLYVFADTGALLRVDPRTGVATTVPDYGGPDGSHYRVTKSAGRLRVQRTSTAGSYRLDLRLGVAGQSGAEVHPSWEEAMGHDGTLALWITGAVEPTPGDIRTYTGWTTIAPDGTVAPVESVPQSAGESDLDNGARLGFRPGSDQPWLITGDSREVRVYVRD